jgi:hypothetical protein
LTGHGGAAIITAARRARSRPQSEFPLPEAGSKAMQRAVLVVLVLIAAAVGW